MKRVVIGTVVREKVTLSLNTSVYADGDVLADTQAMTAVFPRDGATMVLTGLVVLDKDDQGAALDLVFLNANYNLGTENSGPDITDTESEAIQAVIPIAADDFKDLGGVRVAMKGPNDLGHVLHAAAGADDLYIGAISRGTGTYTASGIVVQVDLTYNE